jgi:REP element-mobilizing transposase RayT
MARKPRIHVPGGLYHVILRGNAGQSIFFAEADIPHLEALLAEGIRRFGHRVHAYCWMPNHIHLLIQVSRIGLPAIVQNLAFRYTRWVNQRQRRRGHLFQGRYQAILVDADRYLLALIRYIHLNPVRAGLVSTPGDYPHSSHRAYLGDHSIPWLHTAWVLGQVAATISEARRRYRRLIAAGLSEGHRPELYRGTRDTRILGDDHFIESVERQARQAVSRRIPIEQFVKRVSAVLRLDPDALRSPSRERGLARARALMAYLVIEHGAGTLTALGTLLHRDVATLSNGARRIRDRLIEDPALLAQVRRIQGTLGARKAITKA